MLFKFRCSVIVLVAVFLFASLSAPCLSETDDAAALAALSEAESNLLTAWEAVSETHSAGGNVSGFLTELNLAGEFFAEAQTSYQRGDFAEVLLLTASVNEILLGLEEEADQLTESLTVEKGQRMVWTIGLSSFGVGLVLILGLFGWSKVRKLYVKRVLGMKPEVAESAER